jgi:copper chaperone CopZ
MKKMFFFLCLGLLIFSCEDSSTPIKPKAKPVSSAAVTPNAHVEMRVEGMVCKMGCGGAIRKELLETGSVARVEVDFHEEMKSQIIVAHFDSTKINTDAIKSRIEATNDGQFKVLEARRISQDQ